MPFKIGIPSNVVDLPTGPYSVAVNRKGEGFSLAAGNSTASLRTADVPIRKDDIQLNACGLGWMDSNEAAKVLSVRVGTVKSRLIQAHLKVIGRLQSGKGKPFLGYFT